MNKHQEAVQKVFRFKGIVERFPEKGGWHFVRFPFSVKEWFGTNGTVRMVGKMNDINVDRGLMPDGNGGHFIVLGTDLRRKARLRMGYEVVFELQLHTTPNEVTIPEEMEVAFQQEPAARKIFNTFTPGIKRSLMSYIESGKKTETRAQRAILLLNRIITGYYDQYIRR